jgi:hypothetical protein
MNASVLQTAIKARLTSELHYDLNNGEAGKFVDVLISEIVSHIKLNAVVSVSVNTSDITACPAGAGTGTGTGTGIGTIA